MEKIIDKSKISFYENECELFNFNFIGDEFVLVMNTNKIIEIDENEELYELLNRLFAQNYDFGENFLNDRKSNNELVWHSDCYYNPNDDLSLNSISCLYITFDSKKYNIWCERPIDKILGKTKSNYCICFSTMGNGRYSRNIETGLSLQDDFVLYVYYKLKNSKTKKLSLNKI